MLRILDVRVVSVKYKMRKRGSALLLVVVLVLMLAMMGTAFLMTVRISRDQITGTGSSIVILPTADYWPFMPTMSAQLDAGKGEIEGVVRTAIQDSVRPGGVYRDPAITLAATSVDATNTLFLAARNPSLPDITKLGELQWEGISEFAGRPAASPETVSLLITKKTDLFIGSRSILYPNPFTPIPTLGGRTRIFPALYELTAAANQGMAADADGDGIADAALFALTSPGLGADSIMLKDGIAHPLRYFGAVRIVDNSGAVNVNTAWRSTADKDANAAALDIPAADYRSAYLGAFRPNVGLYELLRGVTANSRIVPDADINADFTTVTSGLDATRMRQAYASAEMIPDPGATAAQRPDAIFISQGDALESQLVRRLKNPGFNFAGATPLQFSVIPSANLNDDLSYHFALLNPNFSTTPFRGVLNLTAFHRAPNYSDDMRKRFRFYGANQSDFWFHTIFNSDSAVAAPVDPMTGTRVAFFGTAGLANNPGPWNEANVRKTARTNLVESNPLSSAIPEQPVAKFALLPATVKDPTAADANLMPADPAADTPIKANVNVATFGELWKAYWSLFAAPAAAPVQTRTAARRGASGATLWNNIANPNDQLITRAALAAVNTLTMRNPELTSGAYTAPNPALARAESRTFTIGTYDVTVYGVRKQPFITEVLVQRDETGVTYAAVELFNPYPGPITITGYRLAPLNANTLGAAATIPTLTILPGKYVVLEDGTRPAAPNAVNVAGPTAAAAGLRAMFAPAPVAVPANPGNEIVLLRPRRDDGVLSTSVVVHDTYNEANVYDLIPIDQFGANIALQSVAGVTDRFHYVRSDVAAAPAENFRAVWAGDLPLTPDPVGFLLDGSLGVNNTNAPTAGMRPDVIIPLANSFSEFIHPLLTGTPATPNRFPFGAFARDGDITAVPFIGHYRITTAGAPQTILELNSVTVDATYAHDQLAGNDANEAVGRFVPIRAMGDTGAETYEFAHRLFDYVTAVQGPDFQATPNVEATRYGAAGNPVPVALPAAALGQQTEGRININTASWQVLAALPLVPGSDVKTEALAKGIVLDRDTKGPFKSIFDLNRVVVVGPPATTFMKAVGDPAVNFTLAQGDLSPDDGAINDYEQRLQEMTRISNLITTRSDSFTAYVLVQAWLDTDKPTPVLAAERRYVMKIDRSTMSRLNGTATITDLGNQIP